MKSGIFKIIFVNFLSVLVVIYSFLFVLKSDNVTAGTVTKDLKINIKEKEEDTKTDSEINESKKNETKSETAVSSKEEKTSTSKVQASAEAIKGNIITRYISPYTASVSYDKVYLKNNTSLDISIKEYLNGKINFKIEKNNEPQVLILHTHATESFMLDDKDYYTENFKSRTTDNTKNMVAIGKIIEEKLNENGIKTLHSTVQHDYPGYTGSYDRAAETITTYLKKYPTIKVILDLHRDSVSSGNDKVKLVTEIKGKKAAQVMLVMGSKSGTVTNFPKWEENLKLAVKLQQIMEKNYPALARPLYFMPKNYNQSLSTGSMLIEFGTEANTLEEAKYSAQLVGESLVELLNNLEKK